MGMIPTRSHGKTALVLAGGGLTGAVYEIGALRAIEDLLVERTVNDFDIYVGTSAGALVTSLIANGLTPEQMLEAVAGDHPDIRPISPEDLFHLDYQDLVKLGLKLPRTLFKALAHYANHWEDMTVFDLIWSLGEAMPSGVYDSKALGKYVELALEKYGCCNDFREITRDLYIVATDLDNGNRAVFGRHSHGHVPVSTAVAASTAIPMLYKPVRIDGHDYVDGGLRGNASLDIAIEHGAKLVVCINPLVPFDNSDRAAIPFLGPDGGHLSEKGFGSIANQVTRIGSHAGLHYHIKQLRRSHPDVDIILIEPRRDDYQMFFYNIMRYSARLTVARHGFESVTVQMAEDYAHYKEILARHGIAISRQLVVEELAEIQRAEYDPEVISRVLERHNGKSRQRSGKTSTGRLRKTLDELERALNNLQDEDTNASPGDAATAEL